MRSNLEGAQVTRRGFLKGLGTVAAVVVAAPVLRLLPEMPTLYGDGFHNDAPALQVMFDRKPVWDNRTRRTIEPSSEVHLLNGTYRVKDPVSMKGPGSVIGCHFKCA